jgi:hypothetical protein
MHFYLTICSFATGWFAIQLLFTKIAQIEGARGFYRGFSAVVIGAIPGNLVYFGGYELGKKVMRNAKEFSSLPIPLDGIWGDAATGMVAQVVAGLAFTPVDVIKERMQVQVILNMLMRVTGIVIQS